MQYDVTTVLSTWTLSISLGLTVFAATVLVYHLYYMVTKVRVACLICVIGNLGHLSLHFVRYFKNKPDEGWYWSLYFLFSDAYSSLLCACLLGLGTRFYPAKQWNTPFFKVLCLFLVSLNICVVSLCVYLILSKRNDLIRPVYISFTVLYVAMGSACLWYAFSPLTSLRNGSGSLRTIDRTSAAVGVWYVLSLGFVATTAVATHIVTIATGGPLTNLWFPVLSLDLLVRTGVALVIATPPPDRPTRWIKSRLFETKIIRIAIRERGVVSTGIVDTRNDWPNV